MNPNTHITIITAVIMIFQGAFAFWVIDKIRDLYNRPIRSNMPKDLLIDIRNMQADIIQNKQDCINIDAKYRIKVEWMQNKIEEIVKILQKHTDYIADQKDNMISISAKDRYNDYLTMEEAANIKPFISDRDPGDEND